MSEVLVHASYIIILEAASVIVSVLLSIKNISKSFNVDAKVVGRVEESQEKKLTIKSSKGVFEY